MRVDTFGVKLTANSAAAVSQGGMSGLLQKKNSPVDSEAMAKRFIYYEKLFYKLDDDHNQYVDFEECTLLFSYSMLDLDSAKRKEIFDKHDKSKDGRLNRKEFVELCKNYMGHVSIETLDDAVENMRLAREGKEKANRAYWEEIGNTLDEWARIIVPATYILCLCILFSIDFSDEYLERADAAMYSGIGPTKMTPRGIVLVTIYSLVLILCFTGYMVKTKRDKVEKDKKAEKETYLHGRAISEGSTRTTTPPRVAAGATAVFEPVLAPERNSSCLQA